MIYWLKKSMLEVTAIFWSVLSFFWHRVMYFDYLRDRNILMARPSAFLEGRSLGGYDREYPTSIIATYTSKTKSGSSEGNLISC